jgi:hypothetical protein
MTITTKTARANGKGSLAAHGPRPAPSPVARRRQVPWIVAGALLVLGCALAFAVASSHMAAGENVLALNRPVAAGQALTPADLTTVRLSTSTGLAVVPAAERGRLRRRGARAEGRGLPSRPRARRPGRGGPRSLGQRAEYGLARRPVEPGAGDRDRHRLRPFGFSDRRRRLPRGRLGRRPWRRRARRCGRGVPGRAPTGTRALRRPRWA